MKKLSWVDSMTENLVSQIFDKKILFLVLFLGMSYVLINPIGLPIQVSELTMGLYDYIEDIPEGHTVLIIPDFEAAAYSESGPAMEAIMKHIFKKNLKVVVVGFYIDAPMMAERVISNIENHPDLEDKKYGEDYALLPMIMGAEVGATSLGRDVKSVFEEDARGNKLADLPIMDNLETANDFDLVITFGSEGASGYFINQWVIPFGSKLGTCTGALGLTGAITNLQAELIVGGAVGIKGAAEYESLINEPGAAIRDFDAINVSHIITVLAIIGLNIWYFYNQFRKGGAV
jgi:hypothetical protein